MLTLIGLMISIVFWLATAVFNLIVVMFSLFVKAVTFLLPRFYIVNSTIVALLVARIYSALGFKSANGMIFLVVLLAAIGVQFYRKEARIVFAVISCIFAAIFGFVKNGDATGTARTISAFKWVVFVGVLNLISHYRIEGITGVFKKEIGEDSQG